MDKEKFQDTGTRTLQFGEDKEKPARNPENESKTGESRVLGAKRKEGVTAVPRADRSGSMKAARV